MKKTGPKLEKMMHRCVTAVALGLTILCVMSTGVNADEADAKRILKAQCELRLIPVRLRFLCACLPLRQVSMVPEVPRSGANRANRMRQNLPRLYSFLQQDYRECWRR